jgi:radical SAM superfamily enzyme with C-terminal helix-hairpin-helix motif
VYNGAGLYDIYIYEATVGDGWKEGNERNGFGFSRRVRMNILDTASHCVKLSKQNRHFGKCVVEIETCEERAANFCSFVISCSHEFWRLCVWV